MSIKRKFKRSQFYTGMTGDEAAKFIKDTPWSLVKTWWKEPPDRAVKGSGVARCTVSHPAMGERTLTFQRDKADGPYLVQKIDYLEKEAKVK